MSKQSLCFIGLILIETVARFLLLGHVNELSVSGAGFEAAMAAKWAAERSNLWTYVGVHENSGAWSERRVVRTSVAMSDRDGKKRYHLE